MTNAEIMKWLYVMLWCGWGLMGLCVIAMAIWASAQGKPRNRHNPFYTRD